MEEITREEILAELAAIGFARVTDFYEWQEGKPVPRRTLTDRGNAAVAAVETGTHGLRLKVYDKLKALELLGKCLGAFAGPLPRHTEGNLLEALLQATEKEVQTDDIPELQQAAEACDAVVESAEISPV